MLVDSPVEASVMAPTILVQQLQRRMKVLNLNALALSRKAKLNETAVRDIVEGKSKNPRSDTMAKLAKALGCTVGDLTGERAPPIRVAEDHVVSIPELDVHVTAGLVGADTEAIMAAHEAASVTGYHAYPIHAFRENFGASPGRIRIIPVRGNSMEPRLWAGQRVMVDIEDRVPSPPGIFVIWDGLGLVIKNIEVIPNSEPLRVRISSSNPDFQPYERTVDEAHINGRVIGVWART